MEKDFEALSKAALDTSNEVSDAFDKLVKLSEYYGVSVDDLLEIGEKMLDGLITTPEEFEDEIYKYK